MTHEPPTNAPIGKNVAKSLALATRDARAVEKGSSNAHHGYRYASAEAIIESANAALTAHGLACVTVSASYIPDGADPDAAADKRLAECRASEKATGQMAVHYLLVHESGEVMDLGPFVTAVVPERGRPLDKAQATALTYNLGYFLRGLLLMPRVEEGHEVDTRNDTHPAPPPATPPAPTYRPLDEDQLRTVSDAANLDELKLAFGLASKGLSPEDRARVIAVKDARKAALGVAS